MPNIARPERLGRLSRADFSTLRTIRKENGKFFILSISKSPDNKPKFACVVSKKTAHKAQERNLIKRRCRAAVRGTSIRVPLSLVFTAKKSVRDATFAEISVDIESLLAKGVAGLKGSAELQ